MGAPRTRKGSNLLVRGRCSPRRAVPVAPAAAVHVPPTPARAPASSLPPSAQTNTAYAALRGLRGLPTAIVAKTYAGPTVQERHMAKQQRIELAVDPSEAYQKVAAAVAEVGKVQEANPTTRRLIGKVKYGASGVNLRIAILSGPQPNTSIVEFDPKGRDVWGSSARKGVDKVVSAIR